MDTYDDFVTIIINSSIDVVTTDNGDGTYTHTLTPKSQPPAPHYIIVDPQPNAVDLAEMHLGVVEAERILNGEK